MQLDFQSIDELNLGEKWAGAFHDMWPAYSQSFLRGDQASRPSYLVSLRALRRHMPEFVASYDRMVELAGGGDFAARFLAQYRPKPFFQACSQAIWLNDEPVLVRNYDYSPSLCDGIVLRSAWSGQQVIAMTDCMSGVLDGMNDSGLSVSLAFGGRKIVGEGFGIALVLRYILDYCGDVDEACEVLKRVPVHLAYNIAMADRHGAFATVMVAPNEAAIVTTNPVSTNHQSNGRWEEYADLMETDKRYHFLQGALNQKGQSLESFLQRFVEAPLFRRSYASGYGTLFSAAYFPTRGEVRYYYWLDTEWRVGFDRFAEQTHSAQFHDPARARVTERAGNYHSIPSISHSIVQ